MTEYLIMLRRWIARQLFGLALWIDVPTYVDVPEPLTPVCVMPVFIGTVYEPDPPIAAPEAIVAPPPTPTPIPALAVELTNVISMTEAKVYHWRRGDIEERSGTGEPN